MEIDGIKYRMSYDLHTHTTYSRGLIKPHGKGRTDQNVASAAASGLRGIAITDHGPGHAFYGIKWEDYPFQKEEILQVRHDYPNMDIFHSVEANIVESENYLDISKNDAEKFDFIIGGYHFGARDCHGIANWLASKGLMSKKRKEMLKRRNTRLVVNALDNNPLKILTHPGDKAEVDMNEVAAACERNHTLMEINNRHAFLSIEDIRTAMKYDVMFVISSDAHVPEAVGSFEAGLRRAVEAGLDLSRIANIESVT